MINSSEYQYNTKIIKGKYGNFIILSNDNIIGKSLEMYGEWAEFEIILLQNFIEKNDIVIDIGAFIGTHTIAFASILNKSGKIISFEPQKTIYNILKQNVKINDIQNVDLRNLAVSDEKKIAFINNYDLLSSNNFGSAKIVENPVNNSFYEIECEKIDNLKLSNCKLIKIDAEGHESFILKGAHNTIKNLRPIIYMECNNIENAIKTYNFMNDYNYTIYLHRFTAFNYDNYKKEKYNIFNYACETGFLCIPKEKIEFYNDKINNYKFKFNNLFLIDNINYLSKLLFETPRGNDIYFDYIPYDKIRDIDFLQKELKRINELNSQLHQELKTIYNSNGWKLLTKMYNLRDKIIPAYTFRNKILKCIIKLTKLLYKYNIIKVLKFIKQYGLGSIYLRLKASNFASKTYNYHSYYNAFSEEICNSVKIDIIIPVYNALDDLKQCIDSILKYTNLYKHRLILINDKSLQKDIYEYLNELEIYAKNNNYNIIIKHNKENMGFVKTANIGMKLSKNDIILLNSDTIVTENWVEKLIIAAYSRKNIATVTPFSNNATICSLPKMFQVNEIPEGWSIESFADLVERISLYYYPEIPTGVGFCIYIKREILDTIGFFNEDLFGKGYGEENDFCLRAKNQGYINILCDNLFIYHKGGMSFGKSHKTKYEIENYKILLKEHPYYETLLRNFIKENPLEYYHKTIDDILTLNKKKERR